MGKISLVVVDDHALFRAGLISLLNDLPEFQVIGDAADGLAAVEVVRRVHPDIVLLDVNMAGIGGVETVKLLKRSETCKVIMLTISKNDDDLFGAIANGADGYLLKNSEPEDLRKAIIAVSQGNSVLSPQVTRRVFKAISSDPERITESGLSGRELEVLDRLAAGFTTAQIADGLFISENTVKTHVRHILEKLEAANRAEAVSKALQQGLIGQESPN